MTQRQKKRKKYLENLKKDPVRYEKYLLKKKEHSRCRFQNIKKDPIRHKNHLNNQKKWREKNRIKRLEKRKKSPHWKRKVGYERYTKHHTFKRLALHVNRRKCNGKVSPIELWSLAKSQKLICILTGEKLTKENISVDHKIPVSKGGTNNISNLQLVTRHSNVVKNNMTMNEFYFFCKNVVNRLAPLMIG